MKTFEFTGASYSKIYTGVLPFSITPADATSDKGRVSIGADCGCADTFDLSGENVNGTMTTEDTTKMRNYKGYVAADWMEAQLQIHIVACLMGALLGTTHHVLICYKVFLRKYGLMKRGSDGSSSLSMVHARTCTHGVTGAAHVAQLVG
jgi:hypothetical protein